MVLLVGGASSASSPFFILEGGRAASDELRATAAEGGRQPGRLEREGGSSFFFLESFILILGSDFVPILGGLIIFPISLSPLLFSSPPLPTQPQEDQLCCGGNPCLCLVACSCSAPHERSTTRPQVIFPPIFFSCCLSLIVPSAAPPCCCCCSKELDPACWCSSSLLASVARWKLLCYCCSSVPRLVLLSWVQ